MAAKPGSRIIVESERVGQVEREGEIVEIIESDISVRYRVRWSDGHESILSPAGGAVRVVPAGGRGTESSGADQPGRAKAGASKPGKAKASKSGTGNGKSKKGKKKK